MSKADKNREKIISQLCGNMASYCAYRERSGQDVRDKLYRKDTSPDIIEEVVKKLKEDGFIDDKRFAYAYAHDKFRLQKWGRVKIRQHLRMHKLDAKELESALYEATPDEPYAEMLQELLVKKASLLKGEPPFKKKQKVTRFLLQRGFEGELIREAIEEHMS
ncbi:MAG: regulatory protein RecX [Cyclobacteriaceae bacterium]